MIVAVYALTALAVTAQTLPQFTEFPIAVGRDSTFARSGAFDGTNYLVGIVGDTLSQYNITAQLVSQTGSLVGSRISVGRTGFPPFLFVAFDGTNYLMVWTDAGNYPNLDVYGQLVAPSGNLVGTPFAIAETAGDEYCGGIAFADPTYMVVFVRNDYLYGRRVDKSGNLVGSVLQISNNLAHDDIAIAFDGTNYLVVWVDDEFDKDVYGQFVSTAGQLVGTNFLIDDGQYPSCNPVSVAFDGSRYLVCFTDKVDTPSHYWDVFGRFVTTTGTVQERVNICEDIREQLAPFIAFDGTNYLITWNDIINLDTVYCKGRFFNTSGAPVDTVFTIFAPLGDKIPIGGVMGYDGSQYFLGCNRVIVDTTGGGQFEFTDGDVYGAFVPPVGIEEKLDNRLEIADLLLMQNTPNPFIEQTVIKYQLHNDGFVDLSIYNIAGQKVKTLVNEYLGAGIYNASWDGQDESGKRIASGVYFVRLNGGNNSLAKKIVVTE